MPMTPRGPGRACRARVVGSPFRVFPRVAPFALAGALAASLFAWSAGPARALPPPVDGGPLPEIVRQAWRDGRLRPAAHAAGAVDAPLAASGHVVDEPHDAAGAARAMPLAATGRWQVPVLLVDFPDRRATHAAGAFRSLLFDTTGAVPTG